MQRPAAIERFWEVFLRPALNLRVEEVDAAAALFTVATALRSGRAASDLVLPTAPLAEIHGEAARRALEQAGATVHTGTRVDDLDSLDADLVVLALPPEEGAFEHSPIVSVHLLFDRRSAACVSTFAGLYRSTLERIEKNGFDVFGGPPSLSPVTKLRVVGGALAR